MSTDKMSTDKVEKHSKRYATRVVDLVFLSFLSGVFTTLTIVGLVTHNALLIIPSLLSFLATVVAICILTKDYLYYMYFGRE